jgi:uncharacterized protein YbjT (DUF2867 family)
MSAPIVIMGATSGIGALALEEARAAGIRVRAFARSADTIARDDLVEPVAGDARSARDVARVLEGARAVVYALGIKERAAMLWEKETLFSETTQVLLNAMEAQDVPRLVAVTGYGAGRSRRAMSALERAGHRLILGGPYRDKDRQEELIVQSKANWTIVRPVILTNGPKTGRAKALLDPARWHNGVVSRRDVALFLIRALDDERYYRKDLVLRL